MHFASETSKYAKLTESEPVSSIKKHFFLGVQDIFHTHDAQRS